MAGRTFRFASREETIAIRRGVAALADELNEAGMCVEEPERLRIAASVYGRFDLVPDMTVLLDEWYREQDTSPVAGIPAAKGATV